VAKVFPIKTKIYKILTNVNDYLFSANGYNRVLQLLNLAEAGHHDA
jgi:hypothetical protein